MQTNEEIVKAIKEGKNIKSNLQELYEKNIQFLKKVCKPYTVCEPLEDCLQEAFFGLVNAVEHYESDKEVKFLSYAEYWIKQAVKSYINDCGATIRLPNYKHNQKWRYKKTVSDFERMNGRMPTVKEISEISGLTFEEIEQMKVYSQGVASLDAPLTSEDNLTLGDCVKSDFSLEDTVLDKIYDEYEKSEIWGVVREYTRENESNVILERFKYKKTLEEIAKKYNLSTERVRQIELAGLNRLKMQNAINALLEKFEVAESKAYRTSLNSFKSSGKSSVENIVLKKEYLLEKYYSNKKASYM